jgi:hypothetical protein
MIAQLESLSLAVGDNLFKSAHSCSFIDLIASTGPQILKET